jgi:hypothetical protein
MTSEIHLHTYQSSVLQTASLTLTCDHPISHLGPALLLFAGNERILVSGTCDLRALNDANMLAIPQEHVKQIKTVTEDSFDFKR